MSFANEHVLEAYERWRGVMEKSGGAVVLIAFNHDQHNIYLRFANKMYNVTCHDIDCRVVNGITEVKGRDEYAFAFVGFFQATRVMELGADAMYRMTIHPAFDKPTQPDLREELNEILYEPDGVGAKLAKLEFEFANL